MLVNYWHTRQAANQAAMKAFLINRLGDTGLALGLQLGIALFADLSFATLFSQASYINGDLLTIFIIFLILGATAKSGQFGLSTWLTSAMDALCYIILCLKYFGARSALFKKYSSARKVRFSLLFILGLLPVLLREMVPLCLRFETRNLN